MKGQRFKWTSMARSGSSEIVLVISSLWKNDNLVTLCNTPGIVGLLHSENTAALKTPLRHAIFSLSCYKFDRVKSVKWLPFLSGTMLVQHILQKNSKWVCCMLGQNNKLLETHNGNQLRKSLCPHNLNSHTHGRCGFQRQEKHFSLAKLTNI